MNQLQRLLLIKHTEKKITQVIKKRQYKPASPRKKHRTIPLMEVPRQQSIGQMAIGAINCCCKDLQPRGSWDRGSSSFLCKCNLTKR